MASSGLLSLSAFAFCLLLVCLLFISMAFKAILAEHCAFDRTRTLAAHSNT